MPNKKKTTPPPKKTAKAPKHKVIKKKTVTKKTTVKKPKTQQTAKKKANPKKTVKKKTTTRQSAKTNKKNPQKKTFKKKTTARKKPSAKKTKPQAAGKRISSKTKAKKASAKKTKPQAVKKRTPSKTKAKKAVAKPLGKRVAVKQIKEQAEIKPNLTATLAVEVNKSIDDPFSDFSFGDELTVDDNQGLVNDLPVNEPETVPQAEQIEYIEPVKNGLLSEKQKLIITYTAIAIMMIVLVGFWFVGIRNSLSKSLADVGGIEETDTNQTERVQKALDDFNQQLNSLGESAVKTEEQVVDSLEKNKEQSLKEQVKNNIIDQMKEELETQSSAESNSDLEQ
jgi:hypothetical protein